MTRSLRILQIEDSEDDASLLLREVRRAGFDPVSRRVDTLPALRQALEETWDIILCDFRMPKLNALMALDEVRSQQIDTPFIIVSGTVGEDHAALGSDWDGAIITPRDMPTCLELPRLVQLMLERGFSPQRITKVLGGNFLRALRALRG